MVRTLNRALLWMSEDGISSSMDEMAGPVPEVRAVVETRRWILGRCQREGTCLKTWCWLLVEKTLLGCIRAATDNSEDPARLCAQEHNTEKRGYVQRALPAAQLFSAALPLEVVKGACVNHNVGCVVSERKETHIETQRRRPRPFSRHRPESHLRSSSSGRSTDIQRRESWSFG